MYSRPEIALFDDIFAGLDSRTSNRIFANLFSPSGLLKQWGTTVLLATQSGHPPPQPAQHNDASPVAGSS